MSSRPVQSEIDPSAEREREREREPRVRVDGVVRGTGSARGRWTDKLLTSCEHASQNVEMFVHLPKERSPALAPGP